MDEKLKDQIIIKAEFKELTELTIEELRISIDKLYNANRIRDQKIKVDALIAELSYKMNYETTKANHKLIKLSLCISIAAFVIAFCSMIATFYDNLSDKKWEEKQIKQLKINNEIQEKQLKEMKDVMIIFKKETKQ